MDPERDTLSVLRDYTAAFDTRILGMTGSQEQVFAVVKAYQAYYPRVQQGSDYAMDHCSVIYIMRPDGGFAAIVRASIGGPAIAEKMKDFISHS